MSEPVISDAELQEEMGAMETSGWQLLDGCLVKTVRCHGFVGALAYVSEVGVLAEEANHHPDIDIRYNQVRLSLVTHDSGGITRKDIELAKQVDGVVDGVK